MRRGRWRRAHTGMMYGIDSQICEGGEGGAGNFAVRIPCRYL
jgi:hypothetical protein